VQAVWCPCGDRVETGATAAGPTGNNAGLGIGNNFLVVPTGSTVTAFG
jgi:hypothetical protein